jgi:hypothetical protein
VLWMVAPKVTQSKVMPGPSMPPGSLTVTLAALEYQSGHAAARIRRSQMTSAGALRGVVADSHQCRGGASGYESVMAVARRALHHATRQHVVRSLFQRQLAPDC